MFYFKLYDDPRLQNLKHNEKIIVVNNAVKLYRKDNSINLTRVFLLAVAMCFVPAVILYLISGVWLSVGWFSLSTFALGAKIASDESPLIEPYLDQVLN